MMKISSWLLLASVLVLAGCQGKTETPTVATNAPAPVTGVTPPPAANPAEPTKAPDGTPIIEDERAIKAAKEAMERDLPKETFLIKKAKEAGYTPVPVAENKDLGDKVDQALATVEETLVDGAMSAEYDGAKLSGAYQNKIRDRKTFVFQFYRIDSGATLNKWVSDGTQASTFDGKDWRPARTPGETNQLATLTAQQLEGWLSTPVESAFSVYLNGTQTWGGLVRALKSGVGGFVATSEVRSVTVGGKTKPLYRITAERKSPRAASVELVVDGEKYLPLTIRVNQKLPDGKDSRVMWSGGWSFGGKHTEKDFIFPQ